MRHSGRGEQMLGKRSKKIAVILASLAVSIAVGETALRVFTPFPVTGQKNRIAHPVLGYTFDPALSDIDERGFRNAPGALQGADLAVIGDSFAYGYNVTRERNFPSIVAARTGRRVYNFGIGSYGIYQYKVLLDEAPVHGFKDVILAFFPANDLSGLCAALRTEYWQAYFRDNGLPFRKCAEPPGDISEPRKLARYVAEKVKRSATVDAVRVLVWYRIRDALVVSNLAYGDEYYLFPHGLTASKRLVRNYSKAAALTRDRNILGFERSQRFFAEAADLYRRGKIGFSVVLIPSKALVIHQWALEDKVRLDEEFMALVAHQATLLDRYKAFFEERGIAHVDALPYVLSAFRRETEAGNKFFPVGDGHPLEAGYEAYAEAALVGLKLGAR